jgi:cardiolipin synthase A/B
MFPGLTIAYWATLHGLVTVVAVLFYVITAHVRQQRRHPTAAIAWILFILLVPYLALPVFLAFGSRKQARPRSATVSTALDTSGSWAVQTILALGQPAPTAYTDLKIHEDGHAALDALWGAIDGAEHSIDLCTFILGSDSLGTAVIDRLCRKACSGVRVRLLLDGMGRLMAGRPKLRRLTEAGATVTLFVPPLHSPLKGRTNLRNHRKMLIADAPHQRCRLWCGGRNLASEYFDGKSGKPAWHDLSFDLHGPFVQQASALFAHDWAFANGHQAVAEAPEPPDAHRSGYGAQLVASGPDQVDDTMYALLVTAAYRARRRIALVTPYFVPDASLLMALCLAARRGVAVDLLLPAQSNHFLSDIARGRALRALALAGGRIWLAPHMLHAKLAVIDDALALAGSTNLDSRSLFLNYELMVAFHKASDVERFAAWFDHEWVSARPYTASRPGLLRDLAEGMVLWLGFQL